MLAPNFHYLLKIIVTISYPLVLLKLIKTSTDPEYYFAALGIIQNINSLLEILTFTIYYCFHPIMNEKNTIYTKEIISCLLTTIYFYFNYPQSLIKIILFLTVYQLFKFIWNFQSFGGGYALISLVDTYRRMMTYTLERNILETIYTVLAGFFIVYINTRIYEIKAFHNSIKLGRQELKLKFLAFKDLENILHFIDFGYSPEMKYITIFRSCMVILAFKIKSIFQPTNAEVLKVLGQNNLYTTQKTNIISKAGYTSIQNTVMNRDSTYTNVEISLIMFIILINVSFEFLGMGIFKDVVRHLFSTSSKYRIINAMIEDQTSIISNKNIQKK